MNHCSPNLSSFKISPWDRGKKWNVTKSHLISKVGGADEIQQTLPSTFPWKLTWTQTLATRQLSQGPDSSEQSCFPRALNTALTVSRQLVQHVNLPALGHHIKSGSRAGSCPQRWPRKDPVWDSTASHLAFPLAPGPTWGFPRLGHPRKTTDWPEALKTTRAPPGGFHLQVELGTEVSHWGQKQRQEQRSWVCTRQWKLPQTENFSSNQLKANTSLSA